MSRFAIVFASLVFVALIVPGSTSGQEQKQDADQASDQTLATFTVNDNKHELKHAVAFNGLFFDDKVSMIWITERPVDSKGLAEALKGDFDAQQMFFMKQRGAQITVRITTDEDISVGGWADNLSLGGVQDLKFECKSEENKIKLSFKMEEVKELGPFKYQIDGELEVEKMKQ